MTRKYNKFILGRKNKRHNKNTKRTQLYFSPLILLPPGLTLVLPPFSPPSLRAGLHWTGTLSELPVTSHPSRSSSAPSLKETGRGQRGSQAYWCWRWRWRLVPWHRLGGRQRPVQARLLQPLALARLICPEAGLSPCLLGLWEAWLTSGQREDLSLN